MRKIDANCPKGGYHFNRAKTIEGQTNYKDGDASFCIKCGEVSMFKDGKVIPIDEKILPPDAILEIARIRDAWTTIKER